MDTDRKPLGYVSLLNNIQKPIFPMDDFFINYTFSNKENWENLKKMINMILDYYATRYNRHDGFHYIENTIVVETQYEHYINHTTKQQTQDIKIMEPTNSDTTYVEFQNKTLSKPPIAIRASNYSGIAINKAMEGSKNSQLWILGEIDDTVLCGQTISN